MIEPASVEVLPAFEQGGIAGGWYGLYISAPLEDLSEEVSQVPQQYDKSIIYIGHRNGSASDLRTGQQQHSGRVSQTRCQRRTVHKAPTHQQRSIRIGSDQPQSWRRCGSDLYWAVHVRCQSAHDGHTENKSELGCCGLGGGRLYQAAYLWLLPPPRIMIRGIYDKKLAVSCDFPVALFVVGESGFGRMVCAILVGAVAVELRGCKGSRNSVMI